MLYLFDIDGTLLLTGGAGTRALNALFLDRYGVDDAMGSVRAAGNTDQLILKEILETKVGLELSEAALEDAISDLLDAYVPLLRRELARSPRFRTMPSAGEVLGFLAEDPGVSLAVATGNVRPAAWAKLERAGFRDHFETGGFGCDHADRAVLVERAIERGLALAPAPITRREIVVVGDTPWDVRAARACGVQVLAVATGAIERAELEAAAPDAVMDTLAELPAWHRARAIH
jgi:phosphoglycolate phosphatase